MKILRVIRRVGKETPLEAVADISGRACLSAGISGGSCRLYFLIIDKMLAGIAREKPGRILRHLL